MNIIKIDAPKSCFAELMSEKKLSVKSKEPTPKSIVDKADDFKVDKALTMERNIENFTRACNLTENERDIINRNTVGQSSVNDWHDQRKGRVTASQFDRIYTRSVTLQKHSGQDSTTLVSSLLGYKKITDNAALKHGRSMEIHAKQKYIEINKRKHRNFKSEEMGLVVMKTRPYIAVSPDLKVKCNCCGEGLVEIKCPYSIKETIPSADNLDYLVEINDKVSLKKNSNYYFQIQGQMAVTETAYTDFFVFTTHGNLLERTERDPSFWADLLMKLEWFWINCLAPEILTREIQRKSQDNQSHEHPDTSSNALSHLIVLKLCRQH